MSREDRGVAGMIDRKAVGELHHEAAGLPAGDHLAPHRHGGGMDRLGHGDLEPGQGHGAALVHAHHPGDPLLGQDLRQFVDGHHRGPGLLGQRHRLAHVIPMAVGHQDDIHLPHLLHRGLEHRIAEPGVDGHCHPAPHQFKGRMAIISDAHPASDNRLGHGVLH